MSEMVERVALALLRADVLSSMNDYPDLSQVEVTALAYVLFEDHHKPMARAAIEAMREPTASMSYQMLRVALTTDLWSTPDKMDTRCLSKDEGDRIGWPGDMLAANPSRWHMPEWRAAIDEALK